VIESATSPPAPTAEGGESVSLAASVVRRFAHNRLACIGLITIVGLFVLSAIAPLLALNQPFYWNAGDGPEFPWLPALFNRLLFENGVDLFFNVLLVTAPPAALLAWRASRRRPGSLPLWIARACAGVALVFALLSLENLGPWANPFHFSGQVINYRVERERLTALGRPPSALFPIVPFSYRETDPLSSLAEPGAEHWLGTDTEGRDVFARMLYGTRIALAIGVTAVFIYVSIGTILGALAGYFGGWVDSVVSRLVEVLITFPSFFLVLTLAALIEERSIFHVIIIIGLTFWTTVARLVRAEVLRQKSLDYVQAARAMGLPNRRIIFFHILPNAIAPALVAASFGVANAILIESTLSFLGVGDASVPSWGETLNAGRVQQKLWLVLVPGGAIFFVVSVFNLVAEAVRDALDPKLRV
jgi:peptide/nickel transport system permease protein